MHATAATISNTGLTTTPLASGELLISGYLTKWSELDRQSDRMIRGAFAAAIPKFLATHSPLCWNHSMKSVIGRVETLVEDDIGVKMTARVMRQPESSPLRYVYDLIKGGYVKGLSAGAIFQKRPSREGTNEIVSADLVECSATGQPQLSSAGFEVVSEGKAVAWSWVADERADLEAQWLSAAADALTLAELRIDQAARLLR